MIPEFKSYPKMSRWRRPVVITEKLDGTNAQVYITDNGEIFAGSRNRWLSLEQDNYGFAAWVAANKDDLLKLGPGRHYGEWWGSSIQRGYGLLDRRFSLFNVDRWGGEGATRPACCHVVPVLAKLASPDSRNITAVLWDLRDYGSVAVRGFMQPEGIIICHTGDGRLFKQTFEYDSSGKGRMK